MKKFVIALFLSAFVVVPCARADDGPTPAEIAAAKAATISGQGLVDLFGKTCIAYAGDIPRLKVWLDAHSRQANEGQSAYFLDGVPGGGKVWIERNKSGNYAIIVSDLMGICTVKAERGPVGEIATYFKNTAAPALKLNVKQTGDDAAGSFFGMSGRTVNYTMQKDGDDYLIVLVGHDKHDIPMQSQISLAAQGTGK